MKTRIFVAVLAMSAAVGNVSADAMKSMIKKQYGKAAFQDPQLENARVMELYNEYKELNKKFKKTGKLPVDWGQFEKCDVPKEEAAKIIDEYYKDPKKWAEKIANLGKSGKPKKMSLAEQARQAQYSSAASNLEQKRTLKEAEIYALKGKCNVPEGLEKSKTQQIRMLKQQLDTTTRFTVAGKEHVNNLSQVNTNYSLYQGADVINLLNDAEYKKNNPMKGMGAINVSQTKARFVNSKDFSYFYIFNNGSYALFMDLGGSTQTRFTENLDGGKSKTTVYQGAVLSEVSRMKDKKKHGLQEDYSMTAKMLGRAPTECFENGTKSFKTDCETF